MKNTLLILLALCSAGVLGAAERPNTVVFHPGDTIYARFTQKGKKLTLVSVSKVKDETAQVIITLPQTAPGESTVLQVENRFGKDLDYKLEIRSLTLKRHVVVPVVPVVAGKLAREPLMPYIEELAAYGFELEL